MTDVPQERSCAWFHREQRDLRSPFKNPLFLGGPDDRTLTVNIQHCSFRHQDDDALLRLTVQTPQGAVFIDLPADTCDDLTRRMRELSMIAQDKDGFDGYYASQYKTEPDDCDC